MERWISIMQFEAPPVTENGFLEFEQHSPSWGAVGAKETSGITSRTARIDA